MFKLLQQDNVLEGTMQNMKEEVMYVGCPEQFEGEQVCMMWISTQTLKN